MTEVAEQIKKELKEKPFSPLKTGMSSALGTSMTIESQWNELAKNDAKLRITVGDKSVIIDALELINSMMLHAQGDTETQYLNDGLYMRSKKKSKILYPFIGIASRPFLRGERIRAEINILVPDELREAKNVERRDVVHKDMLVTGKPDRIFF